MKKKLLALVLVVVLALTSVIGGTMAYLTDTDDAVNVMTLGNVSIIQNEQQRVEKNGEFINKLEEFAQDKKLMPVTYPGNRTADEVTIGDYTLTLSDDEANYVDKIISVTNTGSEDAYVRTLVAVPTGGDDWEPDPVQASDCWLHWNIPSDYATHWNLVSTNVPMIEIDGLNYYVWEFIHKEALAADKTTYPMVRGFYMDKRVDNDDDGFYMTYSDGTTKRIDAKEELQVLALTQAVQTAGFKKAQSALDEAFGDVTVENATAWFAALSADTPAPPVEVPENAQSVSDFEGLSSALTAGGDYVIDAPITVSENLSVAADTNLYCTDANNVVSFENNSKISVNSDQSLALYGVQVDGNGTYSFSTDGSIVYDADARRTTPLLNVGAGATLTLGTQTNIENVVAKGSAVISAKGTDDNRAKVVLEHATITNCAGESGTIINVEHAGDVVIGEGTVISNNASYNNSNHGIIRVYNAWDAANPSTVTMNGGEISNNYYSGNGMIGLYYGKMIMNGGEICGNAWFEDNQKNNGFYPVVYVHSNSQFVMNGGEISGNSVRFGALNCLNSAIEPAIIINGGIVVNNTNTDNNTDAFAAALTEEDGKMYKSISLSEDANVTGTVWDYYTGYYTIEEYFAKIG